MTEEIRYWLMKSEPDAYGINDLAKEKETLWDGIRNYQARNYMREMRIGDIAFFYHSNCKPPCIVGTMKVIETRIVDPTQFELKSKYYDSKSKTNNPRWDCVRLKYICKFKNPISLEELRNKFTVDELQVVRKGNRLSILPVPSETARILYQILEKI
tara:strand:+ start:508 stop:978 length:471 start_codon:yes stop_codon:yes gene_type:complete